MKNAKELRDELSLVFMGLKNGTVEVKTAAEQTNVAGKIISSAKQQCEYYALRKETPQIDFLADDSKQD